MNYRACMLVELIIYRYICGLVCTWKFVSSGWVAPKYITILRYESYYQVWGNGPSTMITYPVEALITLKLVLTSSMTRGKGQGCDCRLVLVDFLAIIDRGIGHVRIRIETKCADSNTNRFCRIMGFREITMVARRFLSEEGLTLGAIEGVTDSDNGCCSVSKAVTTA